MVCPVPKHRGYFTPALGNHVHPKARFAFFCFQIDSILNFNARQHGNSHIVHFARQLVPHASARQLSAAQAGPARDVMQPHMYLVPSSAHVRGRTHVGNGVGVVIVVGDVEDVKT